MKKCLWIFLAVLCAAACTTKFNPTDEDGTLDSEDTHGEGQDSRIDASDSLPDGTGCGEGQIDCGGVCVNPMDDRNNCGGCDVACADTEECVAGDCLCREGLERCGDACVDLMINNDHCGSCNHPCVEPQLCNGSGVCSLECGGGLTRCPGPPPYCADLETDP